MACANQSDSSVAICSLPRKALAACALPRNNAVVKVHNCFDEKRRDSKKTTAPWLTFLVTILWNSSIPSN